MKLMFMKLMFIKLMALGANFLGEVACIKKENTP